MLTNLLGNAIKFTPRGEVVITLSLREATSQTVRIYCAIRDTGIGIPVPVQANLFHAFTQGDSSTTRQYGGTGLGLAISKQLVTLMGGEIGIALVRTMKADPTRAATRVLMLTAVGLVDGEMASLRHVAVDAHLCKPIRQAELQRCLVTLLRSPLPLASSAVVSWPTTMPPLLAANEPEPAAEIQSNS